VAARAAEATGDLVVRVYGTDMAKLRGAAGDVAALMKTVPGVLTPQVQAQPTQPTLEIEVDLAKAQSHGLRPGDVRRETSTLISGLTVGSLYEQQKVFDVVVWGGPATRQSISSLESLLIDTPSGKQVRLGDVARVRIAADPVVVTHDAVSRTLDVTATVDGQDLARVSADITSRLRGMAMPYEYRAEVLGDGVQRQQDQRELIAVVLVVAALIFLLLQAVTSSWRGAAVLLVTLPLSILGGLLAAPPLDGISSVGVLAGLVGAFALTTRQCLLLVRRAQQLTDRGGPLGPLAAAREMAPSVLTTAVVTTMLVLPAAVVGGIAGLEVLQRFGVTLLCALPTSVAVVLLVLPAFYSAAVKNSPRPTGARTESVMEAV
jgi:Cu/Ag efflux pump CusA